MKGITMILSEGSCVFDKEGQKYILDTLLGTGGFGSVFKAHRESDSVEFAIKVISTSFGDPNSVLSFQKELNQSLLVGSDNVVKYCYSHGGNDYPNLPPYIIMEFAPDGNLTQLIEKKHASGEMFDNTYIYNACLQLANGMKEISQYLVHRDIKPDNILINGDTLKISDFGLSKLSQDSTKTNTFKGYGTAKYTAPEAWNSESNTIQMDIYSMGIVFYEIATCHYPYVISNYPTGNEIMEAHLYKPITNPLEYNQNLSQTFVSVLVKMLEKGTQKRFNDWDKIINALNTDVPSKNNNVNEAVIKALSIRNSRDIEIQKQEAAEEKAQQIRSNHIRKIMSQLENDILTPVKSFVDLFNKQYANSNNKAFRINKVNKYRNDYRLSLSIDTPSRDHIAIDVEIVFKENHKKQVYVDPVFDRMHTKTVNYLPTVNNKNVLAWCYIHDNNGVGFNIVLLENTDSLYGDLFFFQGKNNAFSQQYAKNEPFGEELDKLPEAIGLVNVTHIYNYRLFEFSEDFLFKYLSNHA